MRLRERTRGAEQSSVRLDGGRAGLSIGSELSAIAISSSPAGRRHQSGEDWIARFRQTGDDRALANAVECFLPLARKLARRYARDLDALEDLVQVASLGLMNAIKRFDPERGVRFTSFAVPTITGELRRSFRSTGWNLHVVRGVQEDALLVRRAVAQHYQEHGRAPRVSDLEVVTGLDSEAITEALHADRVQATVSLDRPVAGVDDPDGTPLGELIGAEDADFQLVDDLASAGPILRALSERNRKVLFLRFMHDMTQSEIAAQVGCSQMQVSRILRATIEQVSHQLRDHSPCDESDATPAACAP